MVTAVSTYGKRGLSSDQHSARACRVISLPVHSRAVAGVGLKGAATVSRLPHLSVMPVVLCVAVLAIAYLTYTTTGYFIHNYQLHQEQARIRRDIAQADQDHAKLVGVRDYLKSDEYIEDVARRVLGLVRPGETLVVVSGAGGSPTRQGGLAQRTPGAAWWKGLFTKAEPVATAAVP